MDLGHVYRRRAAAGGKASGKARFFGLFYFLGFIVLRGKGRVRQGLFISFWGFRVSLGAMAKWMKWLQKCLLRQAGQSQIVLAESGNHVESPGHGVGI